MTWASAAFVGFLAIWTVLCLLRFVRMYDRTSAFQVWRRWDVFELVPRGAFFGPSAPPEEAAILVRDYFRDGRVSEWTETPHLRSRRWLDALWNPQKQTYGAKVAAAGALLAASRHVRAHAVPPAQLLLSPPYIALLRHVVGLRRAVAPSAVQFAVVERDLLTEEITASFISAVHEV
jgi:hypothetical protein